MNSVFTSKSFNVFVGTSTSTTTITIITRVKIVASAAPDGP